MKSKAGQASGSCHPTIRHFARSAVLITLCLVLHAGARAATAIYSEDFQLGAGPEWSLRRTAITPIGSRRFLGPFGHGETNVLTLTNLPSHTNVTILFDLFVIQSWDGNGDGCCGPDIWDVREVGSATPIFRTSFSDNGNRQAYPDRRPIGDNVALSGAWELRTLGYTFPYNAGPPVPSDSVYQMSLQLPHSATSLAVQFFASLGVPGADEETWGIDNMAIYVEAAPSIRITSLTNHQEYSVPTDITIAADVQPNNEPVRAVEFYANQTLLGTSTNAPYSIIWSNVAAGMYTIRARAKIASGLWNDALVPVSVNGLQGDYFNNPNLSGAPVRRVDRRINFSWNEVYSNRSPIPGVTNGNFSARWTGFLVPKYSETYGLSTANDDGVRLWIGGRRLINAWYDQVGSHTNQIELIAGKPYPIQLDYYNGQCCGANIQLSWQSPSQPYQIIPQSQLFPPGSFPPPIFIRRSGSNRVVVEWATNAFGFHLVSADSPASEIWTGEIPSVNTSVSNGLNSVTIDSTVGHGYFKLTR